MRSGKLDSIITLMRSVAVKSSTGAVTSTAWSDLVTVRAEIAEISTSELIASFSDTEAFRVTFRMRYTAQLATLTKADRVRYNGVALDIKGIFGIGRKRGIGLHCARAP